MREDRASRRIHARAETVFAAFTDPERLVSWLPPEGMTARFERFDDDGYRMVLTYDEPPEGGGKASVDSDVSEVRRIRVEAPRLLVEEVDFPSDDPAFAGTMTLTWTFEPGGDASEVTVTATDVPEGIESEVHVEALESSLAQLARAVE